MSGGGFADLISESGNTRKVSEKLILINENPKFNQNFEDLHVESNLIKINVLDALDIDRYKHLLNLRNDQIQDNN